MRLMAVVVLFAAGCSSEHPHPVERELPPAVPVSIQKVESMGLQATEAVVGTVRAKLRATLEAKVSGRIKTFRVAVGDTVRKGELVAELEVAEVEAKLAQARAMFEQAKADRERYAALLAKDAVTRQENDRVVAKFQVAQATVQEAQSILDYARVRAPFNGTISQKFADVGDLASPGRPLLDIEAPKGLRLEAAVPEALSRFVGMGAPLSVKLEGREQVVEGTVSEIAAVADPNSRTLLVKLDLPELDGLRAGQFGRALIPTGRTQVLQLPSTAVVHRGQLELVFVVQDGHVRARLIKTGKRLAGVVEVVSGIEPGETVVVEGAGDLVDGQPVEVRL